MYIYKTTNTVNGKIYVGKAENQKQSYLGSGKILKLAIKKYGKNVFVKEILEYCKSRKELNNREIYWINELNATDKSIGYNITIGGTGGNTYEYKSKSEMHEIKMKISAKMKNRVMSEDHRKALSESAKKRKGNKPNPFKGKSYDDYMDSKQAEAIRNKISNTLKGSKLSEDTKKKIRENAPNAQPVTIEGKTYISIQEARRQTGLSYTKVKSYQ